MLNLQYDYELVRCVGGGGALDVPGWNKAVFSNRKFYSAVTDDERVPFRWRSGDDLVVFHVIHISLFLSSSDLFPLSGSSRPMSPPSSNIPAIVTTDLSSKLSLVSDPHPSPSSPPPDLLSPHPTPPAFAARRSSFDIPRSPSPSLTFVSSNDAASSMPPPSPTLSTQSSVHFATTLALRENKPDERSGFSSLQLLSPSAIDRTAHRRSTTTFASSHDDHSSIDETEADHGAPFNLSPIRRPKSDATSLTLASHTHPVSDPSKLLSHSPSDTTALPSTHIQRDTHSEAQPLNSGPVQDPPPDLGPFSFDPCQLASLLDPKDLDTLQALGGITSILDGLGTHPIRGLLLDPPDHGGGPSHPELGAGEGASQRHDRHVGKPLATVPDSTQSRSSSTAGGNDARTTHDPYSASLADRKAVYGENILPQRPTTSLIGLMWLALKDKVLVCQCLALWTTYSFIFTFRSYYP